MWVGGEVAEVEGGGGTGYSWGPYDLTSRKSSQTLESNKNQQLKSIENICHVYAKAINPRLLWDIIQQHPQEDLKNIIPTCTNS